MFTSTHAEQSVVATQPRSALRTGRTIGDATFAFQAMTATTTISMVLIHLTAERKQCFTATVASNDWVPSYTDRLECHFSAGFGDGGRAH